MLRQVSRSATARRISAWRYRLSSSSPIKEEIFRLDPQNAQGRLSTISTILHSPKRLKYTTNECYNHYKGTNANLIEDIVQNKHEGQTVANLIAQTYPKSKLVSALVLDLLCELLCQYKQESCAEYMEVMSQSVWITQRSIQEVKSDFNGDSTGNSRGTFTSVEQTREELSRLGSILLFQAVQSGDPLLAALLSLRMNDAGITIAASDVDLIISNLSVESPQKRSYNTFTIIKLLQTFGESSVTLETLGRAVLTMISADDSPYFANVMYDKMDPRNPEYINISRKLIAANLASGNYIRAIRLWKHAFEVDFRFAAANVGLFRDLVESVSTQKQTVLLLIENHFGANLEAHPEIIHTLIKFYGQSGERSKFDHLTRQLKPPLLRQALSLLFALFLAQNNENGAARLLKAIFGTKNGLHCDDFEAIITKLLLLHNIEQAMKMCADNTVNVAKFGYVRVLDFFLLHEHVSESADIQPEDYSRRRNEFFRELVVRLGPLDKDDVGLKKLTGVVFDHLSRRVNTGSCRKLYTCIAYPGNSEFDFSSRKMPWEFNDLVHIDISNRLECVLKILRRAVWEKDENNVNWCVEEMKTLGVPMKDIREYVDMKET